jgi:hypothetical protein
MSTGKGLLAFSNQLSVFSKSILKLSNFVTSPKRAKTRSFPWGYVENCDEPRPKLGGFFSVLLPANQGRRPGQACAEGTDHHETAVLDSSRLHRFVEGQRNRRGRRIAIPVDVHENLLHR